MTEEMEPEFYYTIPTKKTVILTRQFRLPTFLNGNKTGMMIEVCAGLLDEDNPEECIIRETEEETGYRIKQGRKSNTNLYVARRCNRNLIFVYR